MKRIFLRCLSVCLIVLAVVANLPLPSAQAGTLSSPMLAGTPQLLFSDAMSDTSKVSAYTNASTPNQIFTTSSGYTGFRIKAMTDNMYTPSRPNGTTFVGGTNPWYLYYNTGTGGYQAKNNYLNLYHTGNTPGQVRVATTGSAVPQTNAWKVYATVMVEYAEMYGQAQVAIRYLDVNGHYQNAFLLFNPAGKASIGYWDDNIIGPSGTNYALPNYSYNTWYPVTFEYPGTSSTNMTLCYQGSCSQYNLPAASSRFDGFHFLVQDYNTSASSRASALLANVSVYAVATATVTSVPITPTSGFNYSTLNWSGTANGGTVTVDVLNAANDAVLMSNVASGTDISSTVGAGTSIKLRANLSKTSPTSEPYITGWSVNQVDASYPTLATTGAANNGWYNNSVTVTSASSDPQTGVTSQGVSLDNVTFGTAVTPTTAGQNTIYCKATNGANMTSQAACLTVYINKAPTDIALANASIAENLSAGATVGTLSSTDQRAGDTFTYSLVSGTGSADNGSFTITGSTLTANAALNYETKSSYSILVRSTDALGLYLDKQFTISVANINEAPTDISLSASSIAENSSTGTNVASLTGIDPDAGATFTYSLVSGTGSADNASFTISGNLLKTAAVFNYETKSSYAIRLQVKDQGNLTYEKAVTINVTNVNENPTDISISSSTLAENLPANSNIGTFGTADPDAGGSYTYSLVSGTGSDNNASFTISGSSLLAATPFDFETKASYSIRVRSTDQGGLFTEKAFSISVTNVNEDPYDISLSGSVVSENQSIGTLVGVLNSLDPDTGATYTYTFVAGSGGTDNGSFSLSGNNLVTANVFDYEAKSSYSVRVRVTDQGGLFFEEAFPISVTYLAQAPTNIALSSISLPETTPPGTKVGDFTSTDNNPPAAYTYSLVAGTGSADNGQFSIANNSLYTVNAFDYETKNSYSIRVRSMDSDGLYFEKQITISVTYVDTAPPSAPSILTVSPADWTNTPPVTVSASGSTDPGGTGIAGYEYSLDGATAWTSGSSLSVSAEGETCYFFRTRDNAGNFSPNSSKVCAKINTDKPTTPQVSATPNGWTNVASVVLAAGNSTDPAGILKYQYSSDGSTNWTDGNTVTISAPGTTCLIFRSVDLASNNSLNSNQVCAQIDRTDPSDGSSYSPAGWTSGAVTFSATGSDSGSGYASSRCKVGSNGVWTAWLPTAACSLSVNGTIYYEVKDNAGNQISGSQAITNIDLTGPVVTVVSNPAQNTWTSGVATVTATLSDNGAGVGVILCKLESEGSWTTGSNGVCSRSTSANQKFLYYGADAIGNPSGSAEVPYSFTIGNIDASNPVLNPSISPLGWTHDQVIFTLTGSDGGSGYYGGRCKVGESGSWSDWQPAITCTLTENGTVFYEGKDNTDHVVSGSQVVSTIDASAPTVAYNNVRSSVNGSNLVITVDIGDDLPGGSGARGVACSSTTGSVSTADTTQQSCSITIPLSNGVSSVFARTLDNAGNWSGEAVASVNIDLAPPAIGSVNVSPGSVVNDAWRNTSPLPTFSWASAGSLALSYEVYFGEDANATAGTIQTGRSFTPTTHTNGVYYLRIRTIGTGTQNSNWNTYFVSKYDTSIPTPASSAVEIHGISSGVAQPDIDTPSFTWTAASDTAGVQGYNVYFGPDANGTSTILVDTPSYTAEAPIDLSGSYFLRVRSQDNASNASAWQTLFTFEYTAPFVPTVDTAAETHAVISNTWQHLVNQPSFTWTLPDPSISQYNVYFGTDANGTGDNFSPIPSFTPAPIGTTGIYYLRIQTKTSNGKVSAWSTPFVFKYDTNAPAAVLSATESTGSSNGVCQTNTRRPSFFWTKPSDVGSGVAGYQYEWSKDPENVIAANVKTATSESLSTDADVSGGIYYLKLQSVDNAGNTAGWHVIYRFCYSLGESVAAPSSPTSLSVNLPSAGTQVSLALPAGMTAAPLKVMVYDSQTPPSPRRGYTVVGKAFDIEAVDASTEARVTTFSQAYTIRISYTDADVSHVDVASMKIHYFNPSTSTWEPLSSTVDTTNKVVSTTLNHMSQFGLMGTTTSNGVDGSVEIVLDSGTLTIESREINFGAIKLTGMPIQLNGTTSEWPVFDARGIGDGWNVTISAQNFTDASGHVIPVDGFSIRLSDTNIDRLAGGTKPVSAVTSYAPLSPTPLKITTADNGTGMGQYTLLPEFQLTIPPSTYAGSYRSTVIVNVIAGP